MCGILNYMMIINNNNDNNNNNNNSWNLYSAISIHKMFKSAGHYHSLSYSQQPSGHCTYNVRILYVQLVQCTNIVRPVPAGNALVGEPEKRCFETLLEGLTRCRILQDLWNRIP